MQVDKGRLLNNILGRLIKLKYGEAVLLQPYKKDRSVCITVLAQNTYKILEQGFEQAEFIVDAKKIRKSLKILCKREFPRSKKVWLSILRPEDAAHFPKHHPPPIRTA